MLQMTYSHFEQDKTRDYSDQLKENKCMKQRVYPH